MVGARVVVDSARVELAVGAKRDGTVAVKERVERVWAAEVAVAAVDSGATEAGTETVVGAVVSLSNSSRLWPRFVVCFLG